MFLSTNMEKNLRNWELGFGIFKITMLIPKIFRKSFILSLFVFLYLICLPFSINSTSIPEKPKKTKIKNGKTPKSSLTFSCQPNINFSTDNEPLLHNPILHLLHLPFETLTPSSQFENPKSYERPSSYFLKYSGNPKNLVKLNRNLFF